MFVPKTPDLLITCAGGHRPDWWKWKGGYLKSGPSGIMPTAETVNEQNGSPTTPSLIHDTLLSDDDSGDVEEGPPGTGNRENPSITIVLGDRDPGNVIPVSSTTLVEVDPFLDELSLELQTRQLILFQLN